MPGTSLVLCFHHAGARLEALGKEVNSQPPRAACHLRGLESLQLHGGRTAADERRESFYGAAKIMKYT